MKLHFFFISHNTKRWSTLLLCQAMFKLVQAAPSNNYITFFLFVCFFVVNTRYSCMHPSQSYSSALYFPALLFAIKLRQRFHLLHVCMLRIAAFLYWSYILQPAHNYIKRPLVFTHFICIWAAWSLTMYMTCTSYRRTQMNFIVVPFTTHILKPLCTYPAINNQTAQLCLTHFWCGNL